MIKFPRTQYFHISLSRSSLLMNISSILSVGSTVDCSGQHADSIQYCVPPSQWNPYSINTLSNLSIGHLVEVVPYNQTYNKNTNSLSDIACPVASGLLPIKGILALKEDDPTDAAFRDPPSLSVGLLELTSFARTLFPSPLNESQPGDIVEWWVNATTRDAPNVMLFLSHVARECSYEYCQSRYISVGNPDIVGYGMFISIVILLLLVVAFSFLSLSPVSSRLRPSDSDPGGTREGGKRRFNLGRSLVITLPDLLATTIVFTASVIVSSYVYRWTTHSRFDALMVDALSMLCVSSVVMLCASYWATAPDPDPAVVSHTQEWYIPASIAALGVLNAVLFGTHFAVFYKPGKVIERLCSARVGKGTLSMSTDFSKSLDFRYFLTGFLGWLLAAVGLVFHHPRLRGRREQTSGYGRVLWAAAECLPALAGTVALGVYGTYYWTTRDVMKDVYGQAFLTAIKKWGFGQYLALSTWVQPVLAFLYVYFVGEGEGERREEGQEGDQGSRRKEGGFVAV